VTFAAEHAALISRPRGADHVRRRRHSGAAEAARPRGAQGSAGRPQRRRCPCARTAGRGDRGARAGLRAHVPEAAGPPGAVGSGLMFG
jgi:hypothetical protein